MLKVFLLLLVLPNAQALTVSSPENEMSLLLKEEDTDKDKKITILDKGDGSYGLKGKKELVSIKGHYHLSNLLQELTLMSEQKIHDLNLSKVQEDPIVRISRMIRDYYWAGLTRRIDKDHLKQVLQDPKVKSDDGMFHLYVPEEDKEGWDYFKSDKKLKLIVHKLPQKITPNFVKGLDGKHGLLSLGLYKDAWEKKVRIRGVPYVVPGGRFNEMYGWDSYFESLGLVRDGAYNSFLAASMVVNFSYQIKHYGKILNANRSYYLTRSQPPFLTSLIRLVLEEGGHPESTRMYPQWLENALSAAIKEYETVWMGEDRLTSTGLSRYYGNAIGIPPEVEPGHFHHVLEPFAKAKKLEVAEFEKRYNLGLIKDPEVDLFFIHDQCVRESGHDTTYRFRHEGKDRCADFVTVDLNSLLYKFELDLAHLIDKHFAGTFQGKTSQHFAEKAQIRKELIKKYLWDEAKGFFFDYHVPSGKRSNYINATSLYPLWAKLVSDKEAKRVVSYGLTKLEGPGGLYSTAKESLDKFGDPAEQRQWEWPNGWAPHQMLAWKGLLDYGHKDDAHRLINKWLSTITVNARDYNGTIPEKFDVLKRSHAVFAEYGNVGTDFSYITKEGFGWMNASFQYGLKLHGPKAMQQLKINE